MARILYCRHCQTGYACVGKVPADCPKCGLPAHWTDALQPRVEYVLTWNDRRFLQMLHIDPEVTDGDRP